jgi:hypothetical protein
MQQMMIYWQSIIPQRVSGVFTPIIMRADCMSLPMVSCPACGCRGSGGSGGEMCLLCRGQAHISPPDCPETRQPQAGQETIASDIQVCSPDDGRKDARNTLRNY